MSEHTDWLSDDLAEIVSSLSDARYVALADGCGDYELPAYIVATLEAYERNRLTSQRQIKELREALTEIAGIGGNLPDDRLNTATGANDARHRGEMYVNARSIARRALSNEREG